MGKWRYIFRALNSSAPIIVALASLFVAVISLLYSIEAQRRDSNYKELSIRPAINIYGEPSELTVYISNDGLAHSPSLKPPDAR